MKNLIKSQKMGSKQTAFCSLATIKYYFFIAKNILFIFETA
jgi:hypothetical protein